MKFILFFIIGITFVSAYGQTEDEQIPGDIILQRNVNINLILVGQDWNSTEVNLIKEKLISEREPVIVFPKQKAGVHYNYNYNFVSFDESQKNDFESFVTKNSKESKANKLEIKWMERFKPEWIEQKISFKRLDAEKTESFLYDMLGPNNADVNLVFVNSKQSFAYNYFVTNKDKSTNQEYTALGMMGYGGNYNMYFFDLNAIPWTEKQFNWSPVPYYKQNLYQCTESTCFVDIVSNHVNDAISYIVNPAYSYPVKYFEKYLFDIVLYSRPGATLGITESTAPQYVESHELSEELNELYSFSDTDVILSVERRDTRGISYNFKKELESINLKDIPLDSGGKKSIFVLNSLRIQPHLLVWAIERSQLMGEDDKTRVVPAVLVAETSHYGYDVFLDDLGITGFAPPSMIKEDEGCCALAITDVQSMEDKIGSTDLLLHEIGHVLGLNHPFVSVDETKTIHYNGYFNWYSSPMTYFGPKNGCESEYYLTYGERCGIASASFSEFEKEHIATGILISLIRQTQANIDEYEKYSDQNKIAQIESQITEAKSIAENQQVISSDAIELAKDALKKSVELFVISGEQIKHDSLGTPTINSDSKIPSWIKNNAGWWAKETIDDRTFITGIQYLVNNNIISVEKSKSGERLQSIPSWIKNTAGWWSEGLITDDDFLKGIEFLIKTGIIRA